MKIIRPFDLTADGVVESNAPSDAYSTWETVGRNFFLEISSPVIGASSANFFLADDKVQNAPVYKIDLKTGAYESLSYVDSSYTVWGIWPSPDGQYLAIVEGTSVLTVYNTTTGAVVYTDFMYRDERVSWSQDSSTISYLGFNTNPPDVNEYARSVIVVSSSNWGQVGGLSNSEIQSMYREYPAGVFEYGLTFQSYVSIAGIAYYTATTTEVYQNGGPPTMAIRKSIIGKLGVSGSNSYIVRERVEGYSSSTAISSPVYLFYNTNKGHILGYLDSDFYAFDASTLAEDTDTPTLAGVPQRGIHASLDSGEFVVTNYSTQPYLRRYNAVNYTLIDDLDAEVGGYTNAISYSGSYIAFENLGGGYGLIDKASGTRVTQTNPTVTAGDIYTYGSRNYEALTDNSDRPDLGAVANPPTWLDLGFVNPLRMFDGKLDSRTTSPSPLVIDITTGTLTNGLALFNVLAQTVRVTYTSSTEGLVYDSGAISMLDNSGVQDWYGFFFDPYLVKADLARVDLPAYMDGTVQITLDGAGADVAIGEVVLGATYQIGEAQYGSSAGIIDFSRKEVDQFGNFEIVPRRFSKRAEFDTVIPPAYGGSVQRTLARLRATPVVWIGSVDLEETIVYGYFREFDILLSNPAFSNVTITVEGL